MKSSVYQAFAVSALNPLPRPHAAAPDRVASGIAAVSVVTLQASGWDADGVDSTLERANPERNKTLPLPFGQATRISKTARAIGKGIVISGDLHNE